MASLLFICVAIQAIVLQTAYSQCVNRMIPSCGQSVVETILPNQVLYREPALPVLPAPVYPSPVVPGAIIPEVGYAPTVIQDSSVANSLANALQLLVVSNLLSTTLPGTCEYPAYPYEVVGMPGLPAYNYMY